MKIRDSRLYDALDYLDEAYIAEVVENLKVPPAPGMPARKGGQLRYILALAACLLMLSLAIPVITYVMRNYADLPGWLISDTTENTSPELTEPETPPSETTAPPAPDTSEDTDHETTAPLYDGTTASPEVEYDGSRGLMYKMKDDGKSYYLAGMGICTDENIVVASTYDGYPVTMIGESALSGYDRVKSVTISVSVSEIGAQAFKDCRNLSEFNYNGSMAEWENVVLGDSWHSGTLFTVVHCIDGDVEIASDETTECAHSEFSATENMPTCTESATIYCSCLACGYGWSEIMPALGHNFVNNICTRCGAEPEYDGSVGLEYSIGGNTEIGWYMSLDGIGTCTDVDIVVASYYKGYPVKYIEQGAFYGQTQIKSIRLSDTVERIDSQAFRNCTSLESIYIGAGLREFRGNAFWGCGNISKIEIDPNNKYFEGKNCIIEKSRKALVRGCKTTVIPTDGSVTRIDGLAFIGVHGLTSITIPEGVTSLGEDAFSGCPDLKSIHFSSTVDSFELVSVMGCDALEVITVDPKNPRFYSSGNCVIEKETGTLFLGCAGSVIPNDGSIKKIGYYAFGGNGSLVSITVPEGVTYIDGYAFASCESLKSVYLPDSLVTLGYGVFYHSSALESVRIGKNLETMGSSVFDECSKLNNLSFPKTLKRMGELVFFECESLTSVSFEGTCAEWKAIEKVELWNAGAAFSTVHCSDGDLELYEYDGSRGLLYVQYGSYAQLAGIGTCTDKDIVIASTYNGVPVVIIEDGVFRNNKNIRSVTIPDKVHYIGEDAFAFCTSLESVVMPEKLNTLGNGAFNGCTALTSINIPAGVTEIGSHAFSECSSLKEIAIPEGVTVIQNEAFYLCKNLKKVTLPGTLEYIQDWAFANCESLESIVIPDSVKWICSRAFSDCASLSSLTLGKGLEQIQENAFMNCTSLKSVTIPEKVNYFGNAAFTGCTALESVTLTQGLILNGTGLFSGCTKLNKIVFTGTVAEWEVMEKQYGWSNNSHIISIRCSDGDISA